MKGMRKPYRILDHTGDIGIRVWGKTLPILFSHAGWAMFDLITFAKRIKPEKDREISVTAPDREALLVAWLGELLYTFETQNMVFSKFEIYKFSDTCLEARIWGEPFQETRHLLKLQIKAVTYHQLRIWQERGLWKAEVIFDI